MSKSEFRNNCQLPFFVKVIGTYCLQNIYQCFRCIVYHHEREQIQNIIYITSNFEELCWLQINNRLLHSSKNKCNISKSLPTLTNLHSYRKNTASRPDSLRGPAGEIKLFFVQLKHFTPSLQKFSLGYVHLHLGLKHLFPLGHAGRAQRLKKCIKHPNYDTNNPKA